MHEEGPLSFPKSCLGSFLLQKVPLPAADCPSPLPTAHRHCPLPIVTADCPLPIPLPTAPNCPSNYPSSLPTSMLSPSSVLARYLYRCIELGLRPPGSPGPAPNILKYFPWQILSHPCHLE